MEKPILYYWAPCTTCSVVVNFANANNIELDLRDVELEQPYYELLALGGDANLIPYLAIGEELIQGNDAVIAYLEQHCL